MTRRMVVIGAGGFAQEIAMLIRELNGFSFVGFVVSDPKLPVRYPKKVELLGDYAWLRENRGRFDGLAIGIGAPEARLRVANELADFDAEYWPALISPAARYDRETCDIGHGTVVCAGTLITVDVTLEPFAAINMSCTVGHGARIGRGSTISPSVNISGGVAIGAGVFVGTGAQILEYLTIGENATIGAGAVVTANVAAGDTLIAPPARRLPARWKEE